MSDPSQRPRPPRHEGEVSPPPEPQRTSAGELTLSYVGKPHIAPIPNASTEHAQPAVMLRGSLLDESEVLPADAPREIDVWVPGGRTEAKRPAGRGLQLERGGAPNPAPLPAGMFQAGSPRAAAAGPEPTVPETPAAKGQPVHHVAVTYTDSLAYPPPGFAGTSRSGRPAAKPRSHALTFLLLFALVAMVLAVIYLLRFVDLSAVLHRIGVQ